MKISVFLNKSESLESVLNDYPTQEKPKGDNVYKFPANADALTDVEVEDWLLFLGSWRGYLASQIAIKEGQLMILSEGLEIAISQKVAELERESNKKILKDSLRSQALEDEDLLGLKTNIIFLTGDIKLLRGQYNLYDGQFETISRIVTRRGQERLRM